MCLFQQGMLQLYGNLQFGFLLSKSFKKTTGIHFIIYLTDVRIRKSKELLSETDYKINDIAEMVGYQPTYFNRIFKKNEGITPSQYRESMFGKQSQQDE